MDKPDFQSGDIVNNGYRNYEVRRVYFENGDWFVEYFGLGYDLCEEVKLIERQIMNAPEQCQPTYKIIEHSNAGALSTAVNKAILEGFKPIGGVSMTSHNYYAQAMLKE